MKKILSILTLLGLVLASYAYSDVWINGVKTTVGGGGGAPDDATYITQTSDGTLSAEQAIAGLSSGILRGATTTGVITSLTNSAGIAANVDDETGTGLMVFSTAPVMSGFSTSGTNDFGDGTLTSVGDIELDSILNEDGTLAMTIAPSTGNVTFNGSALSLGSATGTSLDLGGTSLFASRQITIDTSGGFDIDMGTASGDDFTIDSTAFVVEGDTGDIGFGIDPVERFQFVSATDFNYAIELYNTSNTLMSELHLRKSGNATPGSFTQTADGEFIAALFFEGVGFNENAFVPGAKLWYLQTPSAGGNALSGHFAINMWDRTAGERANIFRVDSSGDAGLNVITGVPEYTWDVRGRFGNGSIGIRPADVSGDTILEFLDGNVGEWRIYRDDTGNVFKFTETGVGTWLQIAPTSGLVTVTNALSVGGSLQINGNITTGADGADGLLKVYSEQGGTDQFFSFAPHASMTEDTPYLMPAADGNAGEFLQTDGSFNLTFASTGLTGITDAADPNATVALGTGALDAITGGQGLGNVGIGFDAGTEVTSGDYNILIGQDAGKALTTGDNNVAIGHSALGAATTDPTNSENVAIGYNALLVSNGGQDNVCIGSQACDALTSANETVAIGRSALGVLTTSTGNTAVGFQAGDAIVDAGDNNTLIGHSAGTAVTSGDDNVFIGYQAGDLTTTGSSNIIIGSGADAPANSTSNHINIGDLYYGNTSTGYAGIGTATPDTLLELAEEDADAELTISTYHDTEATTSKLTMRKADNTEASPALVDDNAVLGTNAYQGYDGDQFIEGARIQAIINGTPADNDMPTDMEFYINAGAASATLAMVLQKDKSLQQAEIATPTALTSFYSFYSKTDDVPYFQDGAGVEKTLGTADYANIYVNGNGSSTDIALVNAWEQFLGFGSDGAEKVSDGDSSSNDITIGATADYEVEFDASIEGGASAKTFEFSVFELSATATAVTNMTDGASVIVVTAAGHGLSNGNKIAIKGVIGKTEVNTRIFCVADVSGATFELTDDGCTSPGDDIDGTGFGAYGSAGTIQLATELTNAHAHRKFQAGGSGDFGNLGGGGYVSLTATNTLEFYVKGITDATNPTIEAISLRMERLN